MATNLPTQAYVTRHKLNPDDFLDGYNHLNNGRAPRYFDDARMEFLKTIGLDASTLVPKGLGFLVWHSEYEYPNQVTQREVYIKTRMAGREGARFIVEQEMTAEGKIMETSRAEYFFFDLIAQKPIRPPKDLAPL